MVDTAIYGLFVILFIGIPGFISLSQFRMKMDLFQKTGLIGVVGTALFLLISFLVRFFSLPFWIVYGYGLINISSILIWRPLFFKKPLLPNPVFTLCGLLCFFSSTFFLIAGHISSGFTPSGFELSAARDSFWRLAIAQELSNFFPPQIPGFAGELLKNYHFLYDFLIAATHELTRIPIHSLYFHYYSFFSALLFCLMAYSAVRIITNNKWIALFTGTGVVWTGNLSYLLPYISSQYTFLVRSNIFMSDQPFDQSHNPFNLLAYALFLGVFVLLMYWQKTRSKFIFLLLSITLGILPGLKIYGGIVAFAGFALVIFYEIMKGRGLVQMIAPFAISFPILLSMKGSGFSILRWNPGWLLIKMIEDHDRLFLQDMVLRLNYYEQTHNWIRVLYLKTIQTLIYSIGNLNIRIISAALLVKRQWFNHLGIGVLLWLAGVLISALGIPFFFSQSRSPYDSIQFTPYGLLVLSVLSGIVFDRILPVLRKQIGNIGATIVIGLLFFIGIPTNIVIAKQHFVDPKEKITKSETDALVFLQNNSRSTDIILSDQENDKMIYMYIPALSGRRAFLSGIALTQQLGIDPQERVSQVSDFFAYDPLKDADKLVIKRSFLENKKIAYIYLSKGGLRNQQLMSDMHLPIFYENAEVTIYKVQ